MAVKLPIVLDAAGRLEQLQAGDTLPGVAGVAQMSMTAAIALLAGMPVRVSGIDTITPAQADNLTDADAIGLAQAAAAGTAAVTIQFDGPITLPTADWDALTGQVGGLTAGISYYLDPTTAGHLVNAAPTTAGQVRQKILIALDTTTALISIGEPILL